MPANIDVWLDKKKRVQKIAELKEWFGWDNGMIELLRKHKGIKLAYRVMIKEKSNEQKAD